MMRKTGLTLLELILAMTILSGIVLAFSALNTSAARLSVSSNEEIRLQNELQYVVRDIELNILPFKNPVIAPATCNVSPCTQTLQVEDTNGVLINMYTYTENGQFLTISKVISSDAGETLETLSTGILTKKRATDGQIMSVFDIADNDDNLVKINLAAQRVMNNGRTVTLSGISKSILLRGGSF